jgi:predicted RNA-binding Zn-ribbon protein involved in translation (DUF1610 family)
MNWLKTNVPLYILGLLGFGIFISTIYDILFDEEWTYILIVSYFVIIFFILVLTYIKISERKTKSSISIEKFEKFLKGGLYHYKCPSCNGIFAIKKSRENNKKTVRMICPDCGITGNIPIYPNFIEEEIPEKKSVKANFKCVNCGEGITVWAEGQDIYNDVKIYSCPFCGLKKPLNRF